MTKRIGRREFLTTSATVGAALASGIPLRAAQAQRQPNPLCVFIKFLQALSYDKLADTVAEVGFDGVEATVRKEGYIAPDRAADELPKLVDALAKRQLKITMVTTDVLRADDANTETVLRTAKGLGIPMYRMGFYRYDLRRGVMDQLNALKPVVNDLAALNRELGIQAVYQNHSGAEHVGGIVWDFYSLIKDIPKEEIALAFDIRHATIEAGLSWPTVYNAMRPRIATVYVKDFDWDRGKAKHVPLGKGRVDRKFFEQLKADRFAGPISLHVEYVGFDKTQENIAANATDLKTLRYWLDS